MTDTRRALVVVDVQRDFCEGGSLAVTGGADVASRISDHLRRRGRDYDVIVATRDYHRDPGSHFGDPPDYRDSWPRHCVVGTEGAGFHPDLDPSLVEEVFSKGDTSAAYSGFEAMADDGTALEDYLRDRGVEEVDVVGIATDYCVLQTALDARRRGFRTKVLLDLSAGVSPDTTDAAVKQMAEAGVEVAQASSVL